MFVARTTSTGSASRPNTASRRCFAFATLSVGSREVISSGCFICRSAKGLSFGSTRRRSVP
jgi:hypothetical protein